MSELEDHPGYNEDDLLCHCMSIKRGAVTSLFKKSRRAINLDGLIGRSGAGSVCTGCHPLLKEIVGENVWSFVTVSSIETLSTDFKTYRFETKGQPFYPAKAGQHIIVQAYINGQWELRRYTLTTPAEETRYREITVKRKSAGIMSNWLHNISESENLIRISQPIGDATPELVSNTPLVCLVGGIGLTPALSIVRTLSQREECGRDLKLDYSVKTDSDLVYKNEILEIVEQNKNISVTFRITNEAGYINQNDINTLVSQNPGSDFYICGPTEFSNTIIYYLDKANVYPDKISLENFTAPEQQQLNSSKSYYYIGLLFFILFSAQLALDIKFSWLENLQMTESYKIYSGLFLALYILSQFIMPYNKSCKVPHVTARIYQRHKFRGAFAPLIFYFHSTSLGSSYLLLLSAVYFSNFLLGLFNHERIKHSIRRLNYFKYWLSVHIALSVLLVGLVGFHTYIVASY
ncbi:hypothetical protein MNBD_GAMMA23-2506 [hydrothermal vent metagenome]|uniref:FAD-binding FR-type domain-containing protein n=1 Tax=hydrothermal vent metagenome TaxID=652676 RepID=A0A3B1A1F6_9ZZZZ